MARAFPNLRRLHFEATPSAAVPDIGHWRKLDFVSASHPLPLQHPVRHFFMRWHLDAYSYRRPEVDQALEHGTITMLQHILPVVLECSAHRRTFTCIARHAPSVRCMRTTVAVPVLSIYNRGHGHDWGRTIEEAKLTLIDIFSLLRTLPLKGIAIVLQGHRAWFEASYWEQHARTIAACIPTLEYIGLRRKADAYWPSDHWDGPEPYRWYQVVERTEQSEVAVESLSDEEGVRIHSALFSMSRSVE